MNLNDGMTFEFAYEGYKLSDQLPKAADATIMYFGYVNREGEWYIAERNSTTGTYRYTRGASGYTTAWTAREANNYDYFYNIFN